MNAFSSGRVTLAPDQQLLLFLGFFAAFAVKVPIFPLAHLAARHVYPSAHACHLPAGRGHVEDGSLRPDPFLP